jgi:peptide deformylase
MAIRTILHYPDPRLRQKALPVADITDAIRSLASDMAETMYAAPGVGLAAPQIGESVRIFVIDIAGENEPSQLRTFINPEFLAKEGSVVWEEGCLSFPGINEEIKRAAKVTIRAQDEKGQFFELSGEELLAVAMQHEYDHLDGKLMIDHLGLLKKRIVDKKMRKKESK